MNNYLDIFKNPKKLFEQKYLSAKELMDDCIFILDTNVLLLPYTVGSKELEEIADAYKDLFKNRRLLIPAQVAKEFVKNRPNKLSEIYQSISNYYSTINLKKFPEYKLLVGMNQYNEILELQSKLDEYMSQYKESIKKIMNYTKDINWDDPVSKLYSSIINSEYIIDYEWEYNEILSELNERHKFNIPPAYKDKGKEDQGTGDYIIWKDILQTGLKEEKNIIFVTGDEKADWYHQSNGAKLYPRFELLYEFKNYSKGKDMSIINLSTLLEYCRVNKQTVESIKNIEVTNYNSRKYNIKLRKNAIENSNYSCEICGRNFNEDKSALQVCHILPLSEGGENITSNLAVLCRECSTKMDYNNFNIEFHRGSPCQMSGQKCPTCKIGIMDVSEDGQGVTCNKCGIKIFP